MWQSFASTQFWPNPRLFQSFQQQPTAGREPHCQKAFVHNNDSVSLLGAPLWKAEASPGQAGAKRKSQQLPGNPVKPLFNGNFSFQSSPM